MTNEIIDHARGVGIFGEVLEIDDTGEAQTITVQTHDGITRSGVEVASIHGHASNPGVGASCLLLAIGGDQAHLVALPLMGIGTRFGGLPPGGAALYDDAGNFLKFTADGNGTLTTAALLRLVVQSLSIEAQAGSTIHDPVTFTDAVTFQAGVIFQAGVTFQSDVTIQGALHVGGPVTGASFNGHN